MVVNNGDDVEFAKPKYHCEVRRWKQGDYTLVTDDDKENKQRALDLMVFFGCDEWCVECGGNVSYIARDEDNEVNNYFIYLVKNGIIFLKF